MNRIFFNHIPKTAGQYIIKALQHEYKDRFYWAVNGDAKDLSEISSDKYICIASHVLNSANESLPGRSHLFYELTQNSYSFAILRHPVSRLISAVRHSRRELNKDDASSENPSWGFFSHLLSIRGPYEIGFESHNECSKSCWSHPGASLVLKNLLSLHDQIQNKNEVFLPYSGDISAFLFGQARALGLCNDSFLVNVHKLSANPLMPWLALRSEHRANLLFQCIPALKYYNLIGVQENLSLTCAKLFRSGILSSAVCSTSRVNEGSPSDIDYISDLDAYQFYHKLPYDFMLWSHYSLQK